MGWRVEGAGVLGRKVCGIGVGVILRGLGYRIVGFRFRVKPSLRVTVTLTDFGHRPIHRASILVDRARSKQLLHTSQNRPSFCAFYWVTTFPSAKRVSGWPRERNLGGVTGELRRLGLIRVQDLRSSVQDVDLQSRPAVR